MRVGAVLSNVMLVPSVTAVTFVPSFVARSSKAMVKVTAPLVSPELAVYFAVQLVPLPATTSAVLILLPPDWKVTTGVCKLSLAVKLRVISSPTFASVVVELSEAMLTLVSVGTVLSNVTLVPSVTAVTSTPSFPARSSKSILKVILPSVSPDSGSYLAVQVFPLGFA